METHISRLGELYVNERGNLISNVPDEQILSGENIGGIDTENLVPIRDHPKIQGKIREAEAEYSLRAHLREVGLEYEAILPLDLLEEIRIHFGLYKFLRPDKDGRVLARLGDPAGSSTYGHFILLGVLFYPFALYILFDLVGYAGGYGAFLGIAVATFGFYCTQLSNDCSVIGDVEGAQVYLSLTHLCNPVSYVCSYMHMKKEGTQDALRSRYWGPKKTDEDLLLLSKEERRNQKIDWVGIEKPPPPETVSARLLLWRNARHVLSLLIEEAGFTIVKDSHLLNKMNSYNDPISFVVINENGYRFAVLVCQYGKMQYEKEMIEYIENHFEPLRRIVNSTN